MPTEQHDMVAFILGGLMNLALLIIAIGSLFLPPGIAIALIARGISDNHISWLVFGVIIALFWLVLFRATVRKIFNTKNP